MSIFVLFCLPSCFPSVHLIPLAHWGGYDGFVIYFGIKKCDSCHFALLVQLTIVQCLTIHDLS